MLAGVGVTKTIPNPRPSVTLGYAQTLDGRGASSSGSSQWISCPQSLRFGHELRAEHDAIMIGAGTVRTDEPRLTVRLADTSVTLYGVDLVLDGRVEYPGTPPNTVQTQEDLGCATAS